MFELHKIAARLRTQDNHITAVPVFIVQQRVRIYGMDAEYNDDVVVTWLHEGEKVEPSLAASLETAWKVDRREPSGYTRTGYLDRWEFVTPCFTMAAAEEFIRQNAHNLTDPRVYVDSGFRNWEFQVVRDHVMGITAPEVVTP